MRELDNLLQRALILANGPVIEAEHIQFEAERADCAASGVWLRADSRSLSLVRLASSATERD